MLEQIPTSSVNEVCSQEAIRLDICNRRIFRKPMRKKGIRLKEIGCLVVKSIIEVEDRGKTLNQSSEAVTLCNRVRHRYAEKIRQQDVQKGRPD